MPESQYVYDVITTYGAADIEFTTIKYQTVTISFKPGAAPSGLEAYEQLAMQLFGEMEPHMRLNDIAGFFVFKRPEPNILSIHLRDKPFATVLLEDKVDHDLKQEFLKAVEAWKARGSIEAKASNNYFRRKHIWLLKRTNPHRVATISNPINPDRIDINEPCEEGA